MATQSGDASEADPSSDPRSSDAPNLHGVYHFLDVGAKPYGDCTVVEFGKIRILIDGSHVEDFRGQPNYPSIPEQLDQIFGRDRPHRFDLIVVTHCHADHIGCLPDLISNNVITADFALLTDPKLGFGRTADEDAPAADSMSSADRLAALLREEDASFLNDAELEEFIDAAVKVETRYARFIDDLKAAQSKIVIYQGQPLEGALAKRLKPTGAQLLGPSLEQLLLCSEQISTTNKDAQDLVADRAVDSTEDLIALYRAVALDDRGRIGNPRGNGMNCQSITLAFGRPGERVLLAGDMQFTEPGVRNAEDEVAKLRATVAAAGPYKLFKTTHHTSHNGQDDELLDALGRPPILVHSGGVRDPSHPYPATLKMLARRPDDFLFARTDHNGLVTVRPHLDADDAITVARGDLNDFTPNREPDAPVEHEIVPGAEHAPLAAPTAGGPAAQIIIVNLPGGPVDMSVGGVEIIVREPGHGGSGYSPPAPPGGHTNLPAGSGAGADPNSQRFASLLFVTDRDRLRRNIGKTETDSVLARISAAGGEVLDAPGASLAAAVARRLRAAPRPRGIVILGGYDVVPPQRLDVLGPTLRQRLTQKQIESDGDRFIVWSDAAYGDDDGDGLAELPVSRIPDARDPSLLAAALASRPPRPRERFGIRNVARPFAEAVFKTVMGTAQLGVSEPLLSRQVKPNHVTGECHYLMLHGSHRDARHFVGEDRRGGPHPVAFDIGLVPRRFEGVAFTGCCWGALPVDRRALDAGDPAPRLPEDSIAIAYLKAGANAFIGCTGSHYSGPSVDPDENFAARLHAAFWTELKNGRAPAQALFAARNTYMEETLRRRFTPLDTGRRLKNFAQFTCLGLGW